MPDVDPTPSLSDAYAAPPASRRPQLITSVVLLWSAAFACAVMAIAIDIQVQALGAALTLYAGAGACAVMAAGVSFFYLGIDGSGRPSDDNQS